MAEHVNAILARSTRGALVRLSSRGFTIGSYQVPTDAPDLPAAATKVLADNGWTVVAEWDQPVASQDWITEVEWTALLNVPRASR